MCIVSINVNDYFGIFTKTNLLKEIIRDPELEDRTRRRIMKEERNAPAMPPPERNAQGGRYRTGLRRQRDEMGLSEGRAGKR